MLTKPFIKICGIRSLEDAKFAISAGADAIGFITYPKSPRFITAKAVKEICDELTSADVQKVGVFVDTDLEIIHAYRNAGINTIQLHGNETAEFAKQLPNLEIWKAIKPKLNADILRYVEFPAQKFLLDAFHKTMPGGTGITVDRKLAKFAVSTLPAPVILAGGINPANFAEILEEIQPYGMDINSGVEKSPGIKDHQKIQEIFDSMDR